MANNGPITLEISEEQFIAAVENQHAQVEDALNDPLMQELISAFPGASVAGIRAIQTENMARLQQMKQALNPIPITARERTRNR
jgi:hypothetical protein